MPAAPSTGSLLKRTLSVVGTGLGPIISLALIVHIPTLIMGLALGPTAYSADRAEQAIAVAALTTSAPLLILVLEALATAVMVHGVLQALRGEPIEIGGCLRFAAARWPEVIGLAILVILAVVAGTLLFLIPGIVALCGLSVAVPALLVEQLRITEAMRRSWSLTNGYKGEIFFFFLVIIIIQLVPLGISKVVSLSSLGGTSAGDLMTTFLNYGLYVLSTAISIVGVTVIYHDLRAFREPDRAAPSPVDSEQND